MPVFTNISLRYTHLILLCIITFLLSGCESKEDIAPIPQAAQIVTLIPNDVWIDDALSCLENANATKAKYILKNSLPNFQNELHVFFNQNKKVYKTEIFSAGKMISALFFEGQRMVYSMHTTQEQEPILVAYANEKPYAAAAVQDNTWTAKDPDKLYINLPLISASRNLAHRMEEKERNAKYLKRLNAPSDSILSEIGPYDKHNYVINASRGDILEIQLQSDNDNVLFTMGPIDGINMEVRNWQDKINASGDINITVFTMEPDSADHYVLETRLEPNS